MTATIANITRMNMKSTAKRPLEKIIHFRSPLTGEYEMSLALGIQQTHANFAFHRDRPSRTSHADSFLVSPGSLFDTRIHRASVMSSPTSRFFPLTAIVLTIFNIANNTTDIKSIHQIAAATMDIRADQLFTIMAATTHTSAVDNVQPPNQLSKQRTYLQFLLW
jgi:hypothetical protein